ncbi:hypothetical protein D3C87_1532600 [compost metagenome]
MQDLPAQAEFFQDAGSEVLDQDVRFAQQLFQNRQAVGMLEVQGQGLFIARLHKPPQRRALIQLAPFAQRIAAVRGFDLDHIGAEFGANARSEGTGNQCAQFNDFQA